MWTATEIWSLITASGDAFDIVSPVASGPARHTEVRPLWPDDASGKQPDNWSFVETRWRNLRQTSDLRRSHVVSQGKCYVMEVPRPHCEVLRRSFWAPEALVISGT